MHYHMFVQMKDGRTYTNDLGELDAAQLSQKIDRVQKLMCYGTNYTRKALDLDRIVGDGDGNRVVAVVVPCDDVKAVEFVVVQPKQAPVPAQHDPLRTRQTNWEPDEDMPIRRAF